MTGVYTSLVSKLLFPMQERLKSHTTVDVRRQMEQSQWWTPAQLEALQVQRLQRLLSHAQAKVPYYRNLFAERGFDAAKVGSIAELQRLPFLTKAVIRQHTDALKAQDSSTQQLIRYYREHRAR